MVNSGLKGLKDMLKLHYCIEVRQKRREAQLEPFVFQAEVHARIQEYWWKYCKVDGNFPHVWLRTLTNENENFRHVW